MVKHRRNKKQRKEKNIKPLSNYDILELVVKLRIPHFQGVFMRDEILKKSGPSAQECWILNHSTSNTSGSHWCALAITFDTAFYFDSFGKLPPPLEVLEYLGDKISLYYNTERYQSYRTNICGHLCLRFLYDFWKKIKQKHI